MPEREKSSTNWKYVAIILAFVVDLLLRRLNRLDTERRLEELKRTTIEVYIQPPKVRTAEAAVGKAETRLARAVESGVEWKIYEAEHDLEWYRNWLLHTVDEWEMDYMWNQP